MVRNSPLQIYGIDDDVKEKISKISKSMGLSESAWARMILLQAIKLEEVRESLKGVDIDKLLNAQRQ